MPLQNRVQPDGEIIASPARGAYMGNRGILHEGTTLGVTRWRHKAWVTCLLSFKNRKRNLMSAGSYTELFFHDEAVAFAAGHRPCAECRRHDYVLFRQALGLSGKITAFDAQLHAERAVPRQGRQRRHEANIDTLPVGAFILSKEALPMLIQADHLRLFTPDGYKAAVAKPRAVNVTVMTPPSLLRALHQGYALDIRLP